MVEVLKILVVLLLMFVVIGIFMNVAQRFKFVEFMVEMWWKIKKPSNDEDDSN